MSNATGLTWQDIRVSIGRLLRVVKLITAAANGSTLTFLTDDMPNETGDNLNGKWLAFTGPSNNDGTSQEVTDSSVSSNRVTLTTFPAVTSTTTSDTAELWDEDYDPAHLLGLANQAIVDASSAIYDPTTDDSLHTGQLRRLPIPTTFENLTDVWLRTSYDQEDIINQGVVWNESIDSDITVTKDTEDRIFDQDATKFTIGAGVSAGDLASMVIPEKDYSGMTHVEFGIKVLNAVVSDDLRFILSSTTNGSTETEVITIPAIAAITDTWVRVAMTAPSDCTAIISIDLEYNANEGANIVWLSEIEATREGSERYTEVRRDLWSIDKQARELVFDKAVSLGFYLIRLKGGDNPAIFTTDASINEVPDDFIIYRVMGLLMMRPVDGEDSDQATSRRADARNYLGMAETAKGKFPILVNKRDVT